MGECPPNAEVTPKFAFDAHQSRRSAALPVAISSQEIRTAQITAYLMFECVELYATTLELGTAGRGLPKSAPNITRSLRIS